MIQAVLHPRRGSASFVLMLALIAALSTAFMYYWFQRSRAAEFQLHQWERLRPELSDETRTIRGGSLAIPPPFTWTAYPQQVVRQFKDATTLKNIDQRPAQIEEKLEAERREQQRLVDQAKLAANKSQANAGPSGFLTTIAQQATNRLTQPAGLGSSSPAPPVAALPFTASSPDSSVLNPQPQDALADSLITPLPQESPIIDPSQANQPTDQALPTDMAFVLPPPSVAEAPMAVDPNAPTPAVVPAQPIRRPVATAYDLEPAPAAFEPRRIRQTQRQPTRNQRQPTPTPASSISRVRQAILPQERTNTSPPQAPARRTPNPRSTPNR